MNAGIVVNDSSSLRWDVAGLDYLARPEAEGPRSSISLRGEKVPPWAVPVISRMEELAALPVVAPGGSSPMVLEDVMDALRFLTRVMQDDTVIPWIGRLSSGGLQLTWQCGDVEVEAVFDRTRGERDVIVAVGGTEWEAPADQADSLFATVADRLHR